MSSAARPFAIPAPRDDDFEDVHWALSAAATLWERGDLEEGLKWLRRAANAAADRDEDLRAVELFKAAADLTSFVESSKARDQRAGSPPTKSETMPSLRDPDEAPTPRLTPAPRATPIPRPTPRPSGSAAGVSPREAMLRRALDAMDPPPLPAVTSRAARSAEGDVAAEARRHGRLPALRVALLPIPDEGDVRLVFLPPGERAPQGVATALLVPSTADDAELLARLYRDCDAKM